MCYHIKRTTVFCRFWKFVFMDITIFALGPLKYSAQQTIILQGILNYGIIFSTPFLEYKTSSLLVVLLVASTLFWPYSTPSEISFPICLWAFLQFILHYQFSSSASWLLLRWPSSHIFLLITCFIHFYSLINF